MNRIVSWLCAVASAVAVAALSGCATPASEEGMTVALTPAIQAAPQALRGQVAVKDVSGGRETNPLWMSNVGSDGFRSALAASLKKAGLAGSDEASRYLVAATIQNVEQPLMGFNLTVTMTVDYQLIERATNTVAWKETVTRPYTAGVGDAFLGTERLRLANEGAARANIATFLELLSRTGPGAK
jgi:hypothetical protein